MSEPEARPTSSTALARGLLVLAGIVIGGLGAFCFANPAFLTELMGVQMPTAAGRNDVRAVYGGMMGGIGVFLLWSSIRQHRFRPGLMLAGFLGLGGVCGRVFGFGVEGEVDGMNLLFAAMELALAVPAFILAWRIRKVK